MQLSPGRPAPRMFGVGVDGGMWEVELLGLWMNGAECGRLAGEDMGPVGYCLWRLGDSE